MAYPRGTFRTVAILTATVPDRFAFHRKHNALMDIEGPAIITGKPVHVGWIGDDDNIEACLLHGATSFGYPLIIFRAGEVEFHTHRLAPAVLVESIFVPASRRLARSVARRAIAVS
ncbi:hypothetical protein D9M70_595760 [compost metagenome]